MSETIAPARVPLLRRLRLHAGYHWRNSGHPLLTRARVAWDTRDWARFPAVRSDLGGLSISYSGLPEGLAYTLDFTEQRRGADGERTAVRRATALRGRDLRSADRLPDADITILGTSAAQARRMPADASLVLPMRVHFVVDFDGDAEAVLGRISKNQRRNFRKNSRRHRWSGEIVRDAAWFDHFYDHYYSATMRNRHGARQRTESRESAYECLFRTGRLFVLTEDGERIAGRMCHWNPATGVLTSRLVGVRDGADVHYSNGAIKAMNVLLIEWAAANGVRQLDFQGTEPFLSKGTYQSKRLIGTRVILPPNHFGGKRLWLRVRRDTPAVRDFLVANPFVAETEQGFLEAVYFHDTQRPPRLDYPANSPGVRRARHVDLDEFLAPVPEGSSTRSVIA
ncbi:GNAT family N-acetyltransferase [Micromonospora sp. DT178]|uniref:GNAT family N-acetyltransferase n=1 Tax=Micromonospora sp. DT178 TaxID=3393436 RepID=UPI003CF9F08E